MCLALFEDIVGKKNIGSSWGHSGNRLRLSAFDWNHFFPSNFHEIVNFHGPVKDNNAMNDYTLWRMALAMHLFLHECFCIYLLNKSEAHWSGSEWWVLRRVELVLSCFALELLVEMINIIVALWKSRPSFATQEGKTLYYNIISILQN